MSIYNENCYINITYDDDLMFEIHGAGEDPDFDYIEGSPKGPQHWGELKPDWAACKNGRMQSPIDILNEKVKVNPNPGEIRLNYKPSNATIKNTGVLEVSRYLYYTTYSTHFYYYWDGKL